MNKINSSYKTISEVVKILGLKSKNGQSIPTHTIRFWEKEFKQIKPKILTGNRRYYDEKNIEILKRIHHLLKEQGMTINGVKKILNKTFLKKLLVQPEGEALDLIINSNRRIVDRIIV